MGLVSTESPVEFFKGQVTRAIDHQHVDASDASTGYLIELLVSFICPDKLFERAAVHPDRPLSEVFCIAVDSEGSRKVELLKFSGDVSLFISGVLPDSLRRKAVRVDDYMRIGGSAYATAARTCRSNDAALLFAELALHFEELVEVLHEVSENCAIKDRPSLLRIYEKYVRTGHSRLARSLRRRGVQAGPFGQVH